MFSWRMTFLEISRKVTFLEIFKKVETRFRILKLNHARMAEARLFHLKLKLCSLGLGVGPDGAGRCFRI